MERLNLFLDSRAIHADWDNNDQRAILRALLCNFAMLDSFVSLRTFPDKTIASLNEVNLDIQDRLLQELLQAIETAKTYKGRHLNQRMADSAYHRNGCSGCHEIGKPDFAASWETTDKSE